MAKTGENGKMEWLGDLSINYGDNIQEAISLSDQLDGCLPWKGDLKLR